MSSCVPCCTVPMEANRGCENSWDITDIVSSTRELRSKFKFGSLEKASIAIIHRATAQAPEGESLNQCCMHFHETWKQQVLLWDFLMGISKIHENLTRGKTWLALGRRVLWLDQYHNSTFLESAFYHLMWQHHKNCGAWKILMWAWLMHIVVMCFPYRF